MPAFQFFGRAGVRAAFAYLAIWAISTLYIAMSGGDWVFPIVSLVVFGLVLSSLIWWLTRRMNAPAVPVANPQLQSLALLAYLLLYALLFIGIWLGSIKSAIPAGREQDLVVLGYKLLIHLIIPAGLLFILGGPLRPLFDSGLKRPGFAIALIVLCALMFALLGAVSPALKQIASFHFSPFAALGWVLASWTWMSLEAGLCEEFLFRACVQSRLTASFRSPAAAIALTSLLFALSHWPGLYLRGGPGTDGWSPDPVQVAAFTVATLSPLAVSLGLLWARSRSLLLVILVHGAIDALPNTADLVRSWS